MTISYSFKDGDKISSIYVDNVLRVEPGRNGVSYWKYDQSNKHELMYFISYASGYFKVCISL